MSPSIHPSILQQIIERKDEEGGFHKVAEFDHPYPVRHAYTCRHADTRGVDDWWSRIPIQTPKHSSSPPSAATSPLSLPLSLTHPPPTSPPRQATKLMWCPDKAPLSATRDLLATTGDYLRIWNVSPHGPKLEATLNNNKNSEYCAPLTSLDWNREDPSLLGTACIDTTCTIWDVNTQQAKTQIIAHDKEVYDIGGCASIHPTNRVPVGPQCVWPQ
jgi:WD40 repeat protein